jgi:hypothetical protein
MWVARHPSLIDAFALRSMSLGGIWPLHAIDEGSRIFACYHAPLNASAACKRALANKRTRGNEINITKHIKYRFPGPHYTNFYLCLERVHSIIVGINLASCSDVVSSRFNCEEIFGGNLSFKRLCWHIWGSSDSTSPSTFQISHFFFAFYVMTVN